MTYAIEESYALPHLIRDDDEAENISAAVGILHNERAATIFKLEREIERLRAELGSWKRSRLPFRTSR